MNLENKDNNLMIIKYQNTDDVIKDVCSIEYGKGFDYRNLYHYLNFYKMFPNILNATSSKSNKLLSWTHYRILLQVTDKEARSWYEKGALDQIWSTRAL